MTKNSGLVFVDTNVWLYALIRGQSPEKTPLAQAVVSNRQLLVSTQVVSEICVNLIRKASFSESKVRELIAAFFQKHTVILPDHEMFLMASLMRERHHFSYWDSLLIATAVRADATLFYSEDLHDGLLVAEKLRIVNPFASLKK